MDKMCFSTLLRWHISQECSPKNLVPMSLLQKRGHSFTTLVKQSIMKYREHMWKLGVVSFKDSMLTSASLRQCKRITENILMKRLNPSSYRQQMLYQEDAPAHAMIQ